MWEIIYFVFSVDIVFQFFQNPFLQKQGRGQCFTGSTIGKSTPHERVIISSGKISWSIRAYCSTPPGWSKAYGEIWSILDIVFDELGDIGLESFFWEIFCVFLDGIMIELHTFESSNSEIQRFWCLWREKYSCLPIDDRLGRSSFSIGNDRSSDGHRFDRNESEVFFGWEEECCRIRHERSLLGITDSKSPLDIRPRSCTQFSIGSRIRRGTEYELASALVEGIDQEVESLIRNTASDADKVFWWMDKLRFLECSASIYLKRNPRIDHMTLSMVVFPDTLFCGSRVRDEIINMDCAFQIDLPQEVYQFAKTVSYHRIEETKFKHIQILFIVTPVVTNGSMTITENHLFLDLSDDPCITPSSLEMHATPHGNLLGFRTTRTDDDVIFWEIEIPKSKWPKDACELVSATQKWNLLEPARVDSPSLEHRMIHVADALIDICIRKELQEMGYDEFRSSEIDEPIGNNCDFFIFYFWYIHMGWVYGLWDILPIIDYPFLVPLQNQVYMEESFQSSWFFWLSRVSERVLS